MKHIRLFENFNESNEYTPENGWEEFDRAVEVDHIFRDTDRVQVKWTVQDPSGKIERKYGYLPMQYNYKVGTILSIEGYIDAKGNIKILKKFFWN